MNDKNHETSFKNKFGHRQKNMGKRCVKMVVDANWHKN